MQLKTVHQAAAILDVSPDTIRRWEKKGLIKATRDRNNHRLFHLDELERLNNKLNGSEGVGFRVLKSEPTSHSVIELFSGAGGMALGLENAGFQTKLLVEIDKDASLTLQSNRPNWHVLNDDIRDVSFSDYRDDVDVVVGGFPCQAFSYAGKSMGFEDTRGTLFFEFARAINEVRPKIALAENVRGLQKHDGGRTLTTMIQVLEDLGYDVQVQLLRAQFFDVPQKRERLFILGLRKDLSLRPLFPRERDYTVSLREAFENCPPSEGAKYPQWKADILKLVPPGGYWRDLPLELQKQYLKGSFHLSGGKTGMARRLAWEEPSLTLTCSPAQKQTERCHPSETRPLNVREYARIQTFPDEWEFAGSITSQYKQIGNAVPVNLAYHMGRSLVSILNGEPTLDDIGVESDSTPIQLSLL